MVTRGKLIVIEGTDGAGKETQSKRLLDRIDGLGIPAAYADFPQHGKPSAYMVDRYLNNKFGPATTLDPRAASIFYAVDRFHASFRMAKSLEDGRVVVCNRYVSANEGHQGGKIADRAKRAEFFKWVEELEFDIFRIPRPDLTILLYVPFEVSRANVDRKAKREYLTGLKRRDAHEADPEHQRKAQEAFLEVAQEKSWKVIHCARDGKMLQVEEIHEILWAEVQHLLRTQGNGAAEQT